MGAVIVLLSMAMVLLMPFPWVLPSRPSFSYFVTPLVFSSLSLEGHVVKARVCMDLGKQRCEAPFHFQTEAFFFWKTRWIVDVPVCSTFRR